MKKTLAAVLAAAMALSTATVALARDYKGDPEIVVGSVDGSGVSLTGIMGDSRKFLVESITTEKDGNTIYGSELAKAMENGEITASVIVTNNQSYLDGRPSITSGDYTGKTSTVIRTQAYKWIGATFTVAGFTFTNNAKITRIPVSIDGAGNVSIVGTESAVTDVLTIEEYEAYVKAGKVYGNSLNGLLDVTTKDTALEEKEYDGIQLKVGFNHTYGVDEIKSSMKLRFTVKKVNDDGVLPLGTKEYKKGDTITSELITVKASYNPLSNYYEDMQLTTEEVGANNVILVGADLYDAIGATKFTITFGDDIAMFEGKAAPNQKKVNLYYSLDEISEIRDQYPTVDFTFLTFKASTVGKAPVFQNTGKMVFAAKDKNTTVYLYENDELIPVSDPKTYNDTYKTVEVKNVKKLGTYVIADQILEVEEEPEEPAEPVDSTPVAEPDDEEGGNPNTGAC